jgi:hypothetical protein
MNKFRLVLLLIFITAINLMVPLSAQYNDETVTEKSFEQSDLYFQSHFLNTFGLRNFRDVSVGLIDDPFLNLHLNPARLPQFQHGSTYIYLDFRGDRTESAVVQDYGIYPEYYDLRLYPPVFIDPRWYGNTRQEPEPIFSLGILTYPLGQKKNFFIGATYQLVHKDEPFYTVPDWIYYPHFGYDAYGSKVLEDDIPVVDRYAGVDEMSINAHLYSAFLGYRFSPRLSAAVSLNGVTHSREGAYLNSYRDEYGNVNDWDSRSLSSRERNQEYDHIDLGGGIQYQFSPEFSAGIKAGYLKGTADQLYNSADSSYYNYDPPGNNTGWSHHRNQSLTRQTWKQEGNTAYARINLSGQVHPKTRVTAYYRFAKTDIDLANSSVVNDTANYNSRWVWDDSVIYRHYYNSSLFDLRAGEGVREKRDHRAALNFEWQLTPKNTLIAGIYYSRNKSKVLTLEPVSARFYWEAFYYESQYHPDSTLQIYRRIEDKELEWQYQSNYWTVQIPVLTHFQFNEHWSMILGINRILENWEIKDQTTAYFSRREITEDGETRTETNFGERYTQPRRKISEDKTDFIAGFEAAISKQFRINLLLDPSFKDEFNIAQWWLSFRANL